MIPIIDIAPFFQVHSEHTRKQQERVAKEVYNACIDTGFFLIKNYESIVPKEKIQKMFKLMQKFFELPLNVKQELKSSHNRGN